MSAAPMLADRIAAPSFARNVLLVVLGSLLLTLSAKVQVPFWPVPMTMQTLVVLLLGATCGWRVGGAAVVLYLAQGAAGLPVFAGTPARGIGPAYMVGPTGGFLVGFLAAAVLAGVLSARGWMNSAASAFAALFLADAVLFAIGTLWLGAVIGFDKPLLSLAVTPFLLAEGVKLALATALLSVAGRRL